MLLETSFAVLKNLGALTLFLVWEKQQYSEHAQILVIV